MKIKVLHIVLLILFFGCHGQSLGQLDTINQKNPENGKKTGYWIVMGSMSKEKGYANDSKVEEGVYNNSRKQGIWKKYWPNGKLKSEIFYKSGRSTGSYTTYFENGNVEEKGTMKTAYLLATISSIGPMEKQDRLKNLMSLASQKVLFNFSMKTVKKNLFLIQ